MKVVSKNFFTKKQSLDGIWSFKRYTHCSKLERSIFGGTSFGIALKLFRIGLHNFNSFEFFKFWN